jgi:hypothetical protein
MDLLHICNVLSKCLQQNVGVQLTWTQQRQQIVYRASDRPIQPDSSEPLGSDKAPPLC